MPSTSPDVDGCARTLIWVDAVPSTGTTVGVGGFGIGVSDGTGVNVGSSVAVTNIRVGVGVTSLAVFNPQPVLKSRMMRRMILSFVFTD